MQTLFEHELKPEWRKSIAKKLPASGDFTILLHDLRTSHHLHLPFQDPVHDDCGGCAARIDTRRDDDIGIEHNQSHLAFRPLRPWRARVISSAIAASSSGCKPADVAASH